MTHSCFIILLGIRTTLISTSPQIRLKIFNIEKSSGGGYMILKIFILELVIFYFLNM